MELYTVKKTAKLIGCSTNTLYKYLNEGRIKASRGTADQGRFRIPRSAIEEFLGTAITPTSVPVSASNQPSLPVFLVRSLIFLGLGLILADSLLSPSTSVITQASRLIFVAIAILLAYQQGGYLRR